MKSIYHLCSLPPELEVARMSTDGTLPDLRFPQTGGQGNSIHLSANTLKQHGRNGRPPTHTATLAPRPGGIPLGGCTA